MSQPLANYIEAEMETIITVALMNFAADTTHTDHQRKLAEDYAAALQNDTWLMETATPSEDAMEWMHLADRTRA